MAVNDVQCILLMPVALVVWIDCVKKGLISSISVQFYPQCHGHTEQRLSLDQTARQKNVTCSESQTIMKLRCVYDIDNTYALRIKNTSELRNPHSYEATKAVAKKAQKKPGLERVKFISVI